MLNIIYTRYIYTVEINLLLLVQRKTKHINSPKTRNSDPESLERVCG